MFRFRLISLALLILLMLAGCNVTATTQQATESLATAETASPIALENTAISSRTLVLSPTPKPLTATPTATRIPSTATITPTSSIWDPLGEGIEERFVPIHIEEGDEGLRYAYALRIDPSMVTFQVHYSEGFAQPIDAWQASLGASIVVNGGFFSGDYTPVGRIVSDGTMFGFPLNYGERTIGVAGLFTVLDGQISMYTLGRGAYSPRGMRFDQALESYPILLLPGRQPTYPTETNEKARRTVIGLDSQGRLIILVSDLPLFTLHNLSGWLAESDLDMDIALNLDGGRSTGLVVSLPGHRREISSFVDLPIVLAIYPKD
jgi:uncharacterized protein YigE (DUF2233 family)